MKEYTMEEFKQFEKSNSLIEKMQAEVKPTDGLRLKDKWPRSLADYTSGEMRGFPNAG